MNKRKETWLNTLIWVQCKLPSQCIHASQMTITCLCSLHTGLVHLEHQLLAFRSLAAGQILQLFLFTWPSCLMSSCGWVVAAFIFLNTHLPIASVICVWRWGVPSMRPFICGIISSLPSSLMKSRRAVHYSSISVLSVVWSMLCVSETKWQINISNIKCVIIWSKSLLK